MDGQDYQYPDDAANGFAEQPFYYGNYEDEANQQHVEWNGDERNGNGDYAGDFEANEQPEELNGDDLPVAAEVELPNQEFNYEIIDDIFNLY